MSPRYLDESGLDVGSEDLTSMIYGLGRPAGCTKNKVADTKAAPMPAEKKSCSCASGKDCSCAGGKGCKECESKAEDKRFAVKSEVSNTTHELLPKEKREMPELLRYPEHVPVAEMRKATMKLMAGYHPDIFGVLGRSGPVEDSDPNVVYPDHTPPLPMIHPMMGWLRAEYNAKGNKDVVPPPAVPPGTGQSPGKADPKADPPVSKEGGHDGSATEMLNDYWHCNCYQSIQRYGYTVGDRCPHGADAYVSALANDNGVMDRFADGGWHWDGEYCSFLYECTDYTDYCYSCDWANNAQQVQAFRDFCIRKSGCDEYSSPVFFFNRETGKCEGSILCHEEWYIWDGPTVEPCSKAKTHKSTFRMLSEPCLVAQWNDAAVEVTDTLGLGLAAILASRRGGGGDLVEYEYCLEMAAMDFESWDLYCASMGNPSLWVSCHATATFNAVAKASWCYLQFG